MDSLLKLCVAVVVSAASVLFFLGGGGFRVGFSKSTAYSFFSWLILLNPSCLSTITFRRLCLTSGWEEMTGFISSPSYLCECVSNNPDFEFEIVGLLSSFLQKTSTLRAHQNKIRSYENLLKCPKQCLRCKTTTSTQIQFGRKNMPLN